MRKLIESKRNKKEKKLKIKHNGKHNDIKIKSDIKKVLYRIGDEAGLYSELNNMFLCAYFCKKDGIEFYVSSFNSKIFPYGINTYLNQPSDISFVNKENDSEKSSENTRGKIVLSNEFKCFLASNGYNLITSDIFQKYRDLKNGIDFIEFKDFVNKNYILNDNILNKVEIFKKQIGLPSRYTSILVRRGDKQNEANLVDLDLYMEKIKDCDDVFVFTDDYSIIEILKSTFPNKRFYTTTIESERGYDHYSYINNSKDIISDRIGNVISNIEILRQSDKAYVTFTSNPSSFLYLVMDNGKCEDIEGNNFYIM